jgi:hypothetical protein
MDIELRSIKKELGPNSQLNAKKGNIFCRPNLARNIDISSYLDFKCRV